MTAFFQGQFVIVRLGHAMVNLPTKFEVSTFSHYRDMKCMKKCTKWGGLGGYESPKVIGNVTIQ